MKAAPKQVWTPVYDEAQAVQIKAKKWREDHPTWVVRDGVLWVLKEKRDGL